MADHDTRLTALNAVLRVAVRHPNLLQPKAFEELADTIGEFVRFRIMAVLLPEAGDQNRLYATSRGASLPFASFGARMTASEEFQAKVFGAGEVHRCDDTRAGGELERAAAAAGLLSYIAIPVPGAGGRRDVVATLIFAHGEAGAASTAHADLLIEIAGVIGVSLDRALQLSRERRLAMILETSSDAMLAWDRDGVVTDLNGAALRLTGRGREELLGASIRDLLGPLPDLDAPSRATPDSQPEPWFTSGGSAGQAGASGPHGTRMELSARGPDGAPVRRAVAATITAVEEDPIVAAHALLRDLSQVVAAEREAAERLARIHELEEQHRTLLDSAPLIIFRLDPRTEALVYLNRHAERLLGVPVAEALATPGFLRDVHADADGITCFEDAVARAKLGAGSLPYEARLRRRQGEAITARGTVYPLVSDRGAVVGIQGVLADVTAEHAARTRLVQLDRLSTLGTLAAGVAHEINNPAAFLLLGVGMLERILRGPQVRMEGAAASNAADLLRELRESIQRIVDITKDLRLFASSPSSEPGRRALIDVNRSVESALSLTRGQIIERARIDLRLGEVPPVLMDEGRLGQVIVNLLVNAAQAIPRPSSRQGAKEHVVTVETRTDGRTVEIEVRDTGSGINPEILPRIWAPFFTTKSPEVGTGLGLSISREIIERAGGVIRVESPFPAPGAAAPAEPGGSRFVITLPAEGRTEVLTPVTTPVPRLVSERVRVLVVEDEAPLARALAEQLGRVHQITLAPNADAALTLADKGEHFDAVLCDLRMPGLSGDALYTKIAETHPALAQRFIFMTGVGFGAEVERFLASSGRPLLEKPFLTEDALAAIAEVVTASRAAARGGA